MTFRHGLLAASFGFLASCATLPKNFQATVSTAIPQSESTALGRLLKDDLALNSGLSGFCLLNTGRQGFETRIALAEVAERTIDCQYFIWDGDASGIILIDRLAKAADRGVRVRLLLDDMASHGKDLGLAVLNRHPNIEIRVFNPLGRRYFFGLFRTLSLAFYAGRMTNRMHNKIFAVDNQTAIVGGRNIADAYFGVDKRSNFRDLDLVAVGPVVGEISTAFDDYWNSTWSVPFEIFKTKLPSEKQVQKKMKQLAENFQKLEAAYPYPLTWDKESLLSILRESKKKLVWGNAEVLCDSPGKAWEKAERGKSKSEIVNRLSHVAGDAQKDILVVSPYFILSEGNIPKFGDVVRRGVTMRIFTNSLASTDAIPVVAMYRPLREGLLKEGVKLFEMRPDAASRKTHMDNSADKARLSLHAKAVVIDGETVFVGTFNIDPRSEHLNTEVGLLVHSPELAQEILRHLEEDISPPNSYSLTLSPNGKNVVWSCDKNGETKTYGSDPEAGFWLRFGAGFLSILPIRSQL